MNTKKKRGMECIIFRPCLHATFLLRSSLVLGRSVEENVLEVYRNSYTMLKNRLSIDCSIFPGL